MSFETPQRISKSRLEALSDGVCTGALYLNWQYAWNRGQVMVKDSDVVVMERFRGRTLRAAVAYLLATVVAWFSPITGFYLYIAVALVFAFRQIRTRAMERVLRHT